MSVWKLLKDKEPVLARMWDRSVYPDILLETRKGGEQ